MRTLRIPLCSDICNVGLPQAGSVVKWTMPPARAGGIVVLEKPASGFSSNTEGIVGLGGCDDTVVCECAAEC